MRDNVFRLLDLVLSAVGLLVGAPLLLLVCAIAYFDTGSPLFVQMRVGKAGRRFALVKFRTMRVGTQSLPTHLVERSSITRFGGFLRSVKLDELPQLWNVLKGEMSLVGPRPCLPTQVDLIREREMLGVFVCRPGITGLAQLQGVDMSVPRKLAELDAKMMRELTVPKYFSFLIRTAIGQGSGDPAARL